MKKLLFSLVAAAACGAVTAAPVEFTDLTTFDPAKPDNGGTVSNENRIYWEIDTSTDPELTVANGEGASLGYLQLNTGSTPLWRTFAGVADPELATDANLDAAGVPADGKVVSSDVKLTACTEWPTLTDFAGEKLALFLFAPEEGDTSGKTAGLYAVGGAMVEGGLTSKAYKLDIDVDTVTKAQGWAKVSIKTYGDIYNGNNTTTYPAFVIGINGSVVGVVAGDYVTGFENADNLKNVATTRIGNKTLIPAAVTGDGTIAGLGFQGEGGIDNVDLAAADFAVDAVTMSATISSDVTATFTGATFADGALTFTVGTPITFTVASDLDIVTVMYNDEALAPVGGVYTIATPATTDTLVISAAPAAFQIGDAKYATLADALDGLTSGSTLKLLAACDVGTAPLTVNTTVGTVTLDLNGQTIQGSGTAVIVNSGATLTITDSSEGGCVKSTAATPVAVQNASGTLTVADGDYIGEIRTGTRNVKTYINGGRFTVKVEAVEEVVELADGKVWSDTVDSDGYYTLVDEAGEDTEVPSVGEGEGSVTVDTDGDATVVPAVGKTEVTITLPSDFAGDVIVPSSLDKIVGVPASKLVIKSGDYVVTGAFSYDTETGAIALNAEATVNGVPVKPVLDTTATDPFVGGATPAAKVKTIPGLKYSLTYATDVGATTYTEVTTPAMAEEATMTLTDTRPAGEGEGQRNPNKGFYKVKVSK